MNEPLRFLRLAVGFNRPASKTRVGRLLRRAARPLVPLSFLYLGLQAFPQVLFARSVTAGGITFYSRTSLPPEAVSCAVRARQLLRRCELAAPDRQERIFVCGSPWLFRLFGPATGGAFAFSVPLTNNVFIARADFHLDIAHSEAPVYNTRSLSGVVAHEITHGLIRRRLGLWRAARLPNWMAEGYCDTVAQESSFPEARGLRLMASGQDDAAPSFRYFKARQMVRYLMEGQRLSFGQMIGRAGDFAVVEAQTRHWLQARRTRGRSAQPEPAASPST